MALRCLIAALCLICSRAYAAPPAPPGTFRAAVELEDGWQAVQTHDHGDHPPGKGWKAQPVPGLFWSEARGGSSYAWYRRTIKVPAGWRGRRVFLRLAGAKFDAHVWIDGKPVGSRLEGYTPWEIEITRFVSQGSTNRIDIRCQDWGATFADGWTLPAKVDGDVRYATGGRTLAPVGGHFYAFGLWDGVRLEAKPKTHLDDVAIAPSVRRGTLTVEGTVAGARPGQKVEAEVLDGPAVRLTLAATATGTDGRWRLAAPFPDAPRWSPESPRLLVLRLTLRDRDGRVADVLETRFGFRELWADGPDFILNGVKRHLLATSTWPPTEPETPDHVREILRQAKTSNSIAMRFHTQPWREVWLEEADALGLMVVDEAALWCDGGGGYAYKDPRFWANYREHVAGMIRRDRNHASLVMWSLENELLHCGGADSDPGLEGKLADLGRFVKGLDPSRLITYEADLDPGGVADVVGLHYPHELPDWSDWPDTADWMDSEVATGTAGGLLGSRGAKFKWDRKKPLYIGEYLWVPDSSAAPGTIYYGDETYVDTGAYCRRAKARSWEDQAVAYRRAGVSGQCPWTMFEGSVSRFPLDLNPDENILWQAQRGSYVPVAAYLRECDTRFFRGEPVTRTFDVFNDSTAAARLVVAWTVAPAGPNGSATLTLEPGGRAVVPIRVVADAAGSATLAAFASILTAEGFKVHQHEQRWVLETKLPVAAPAGFRVRLFDPSGTWRAKLAAEGLKTSSLAELKRAAKLDPARDLILIAPYALADPPDAGGAKVPVVGREAPGRNEFTAFLARGGRALVMEQATLAPILPGLELVDHASTMAFPVGPDPVLAGLGADDFKFWRPGHYVSRREIRRPETGGARTLVVSGGREMLDQGPVVDLPVGAGRLILLQALCGEKLGTEPAARRLFRNALDVLAAAGAAVAVPADAGTARLPVGGTVLAGGDDAFAAQLSRLGVRFSRGSRPLRDGDLVGTDLVILDGPADAAVRAVVGPWLASGGRRTLYWHSPDPASFAAWRAPLGLAGLAVAPSRGPLTVPDRSSAVLAGVSREDLCFLGPIVGEAWMRQRDPDPNVIDAAFLPDLPPAAGTVVPAAAMTRSGALTGDEPGGGAWLFTNGSFSATVMVPAAGRYPLTLVAGGTPMAGVWPLVTVRANGLEACRISLSRSGPAAYSALASLPAGTVRLVVEFTNDASGNGEDRNFLLQSVAIGRRPWDPGEAEILALPPALVSRKLPPGSRVVVDEVRWDEARNVPTRAHRYASALLANLGAAFEPPPPEPDWIPAGAFRKSGEFENFSANAERLYFGSNGAAEAPFECAAAGRYAVVVRGGGSPAAGVFPRTRVTVDGAPAGEVEVTAESPAAFATGVTVTLAPGPHKVRVEFLNDLYKPPEDRNLEVTAVGLRRVE